MFAEEKQKLLNQLELYSNKLFFPLSLITSLNNNGLSTLSSFFNTYNSCIKKFRKLKNKLNNLTEWGIFYNSHYLWKYSVLSTITKINVYVSEIINYVNGVNVDTIRQMIMNQNSIKINNIVSLLLIQKINNKYILLSKDKKIIYTIDEIKMLYPRCILPINQNNNKIVLEDKHDLDPSDILVELDDKHNLHSSNILVNLTKIVLEECKHDLHNSDILVKLSKFVLEDKHDLNSSDILELLKIVLKDKHDLDSADI